MTTQIIEKERCPKCGEEIDIEDIICPHCGVFLLDGDNE